MRKHGGWCCRSRQTSDKELIADRKTRFSVKTVADFLLGYQKKAGDYLDALI